MKSEELAPQALLTRMTFKSLGAFLLAYCILYYVSMYVGMVGASEFGISSIIHVNNIDFLISSHDWKIRSVIAAYGFPFLFYVVAGITSYALFSLFIRYRMKQLTWFWSWLSILSSLFIFGSLIAGIVSKKGVHFALIFFNYGWNIRGDEYEYFYLIPAVVGLTFTAIICRKMFMELSPSIALLVELTNSRVLFHIMLLPAMLGVLLILISHSPEITLYDGILFICVLVPLIVGTLSSNNIRSIMISKYPAESNFLLWSIAGILVIIASRIILQDGINFIAQ
jgi:hypothetical protein